MYRNINPKGNASEVSHKLFQGMFKVFEISRKYYSFPFMLTSDYDAKNWLKVNFD